MGILFQCSFYECNDADDYENRLEATETFQEDIGIVGDSHACKVAPLDDEALLKWVHTKQLVLATSLSTIIILVGIVILAANCILDFDTSSEIPRHLLKDRPPGCTPTVATSTTSSTRLNNSSQTSHADNSDHFQVHSTTGVDLSEASGLSVPALIVNASPDVCV